MIASHENSQPKRRMLHGQTKKPTSLYEHNIVTLMINTHGSCVNVGLNGIAYEFEVSRG